MHDTPMLDMGDITFEENRDIKVGTLRFTSGATVRVKNAAKVNIECETLIFDGPLTVDVGGVNGRDGIDGSPDRAVWVSGMHHEDHPRRHREWVAAITTPNPSEEGVSAMPGTDGTNGGTFVVQYGKLGDGAGLGVLTKVVAGGRAGKSAKGSKGQLMICGSPSHMASEQRWRPDGASWEGMNGRDGVVSFNRRTG